MIAPRSAAERAPVEMRWYAEGRAEDVPEPMPLPAQFSEPFGRGLPTQSGKFEFVASSLKRVEAQDPERPALNMYRAGWEGSTAATRSGEFPLQLVTVHPRYSFHTYADGKESDVSTLKDHRIAVDGYRYWVLRINAEDAQRRGIGQHDLVKIWNTRGAVICAADVTPTVAPGVVRANESCAEFDLVRTSEGLVDRGGCLNLLTPGRPMTQTADGIAPNSCLVEVRKWERVLEAVA